MLAGLEQGACGEAWNLNQPSRVLGIQQRYAQAGADCIISNTFGASRITLRRHSQEAELAAINAAGVRLAREAFGGRTGYVLGDIGPLGALLEPYGDLTEAEARSALEEQARALVGAGADAPPACRAQSGPHHRRIRPSTVTVSATNVAIDRPGHDEEHRP